MLFGQLDEHILRDFLGPNDTGPTTSLWAVDLPQQMDFIRWHNMQELDSTSSFLGDMSRVFQCDGGSFIEVHRTQDLPK
jgi:hypothetical protein